MVKILRRATNSPLFDGDAMRAFREQWQMYRKAVDHSYLAHREVRDVLHRELVETVNRPFRFLDLACGDASTTVAALQGTQVIEYHGIDLSAPALAIAEKTVESLPCEVQLEQNDFVEAMCERTTPADVVWIGLSLYHLQSVDAKRDFMRSVRAVIENSGLFLIFEPTSLEGETRAAYLDRYESFVNSTWTALTPAERAMVLEHTNAADFPEQASTWAQLGRDAGFSCVDSLFTDPPNLLSVFRYRP
jgi:SAM-dependent methyltransferase